MSLNSALREIVELAERLGYDVLEIDARDFVRVKPHRSRVSYDEDYIEFRGLFAKDTMERCLRDISDPDA